MSKYRLAHQCDACGKILGDWVYYGSDSCCYGTCCPKCGKIGRFKRVAARPRFFGILGWELPENFQNEQKMQKIYKESSKWKVY